MRKLNVLGAVLGILVIGPIAASQVSAQTEVNAPEMTEGDEARLDELMSLMADELTILRQTVNRRDREALMQTHRENMREALTLMSGMGGETMGRMVEHMSMAEAPASTETRHVHKRPMAQRSEISDATRLMDLEARVDMMHMMMEFMLEQSD